MKQYILDDYYDKLINYSKQGKEFQLSIPTPGHYLPLLFALALKHKSDDIMLFNDQPVGGSLSMTSIKFS